jgi:hypothetical protein
MLADKSQEQQQNEVFFYTGLLNELRVPAFQKTEVLSSRVARWLLFEPKIPVLVNFGWSCNGRCWYILWPFGQFSGHLAQFMTIWYIFPRFGTFYPLWYVVPRKIWQPCFQASCNLLAST